MNRLSKCLAASAALLMLAGCGSTGAQTAASKPAEPKDEAAEFGADLADMLNDGKSKELFDLWMGSSIFEPLSDAVMPDAKAKGIEWKYKEGALGKKEGSVTLKWTTPKLHSTKEYKVKRVDGKWRLESDPLMWVNICSPFSVDGTEAPVIDELGNEQGPCYSDGGEEGEVPQAGQILLVAPGEHTFSLDVLKEVVEQPYKAMAYPTTDAALDFTKRPGIQNGYANLVPDKPGIAAGYADAVKAAFKAAKNEVSDDGYDQHPDLFDGITVTPTSDLSRPDVSGTYRHWADGGYQDRDISELSYGTTINWTGFVVLYNEVSRP